MIDRRQFEREDHDVPVRTIYKNHESESVLTDLSPDGFGLIVKDTVHQGQPLDILFENFHLKTKIMYVDGANIGVKLDKPAHEAVARLQELKNS